MSEIVRASRGKRNLRNVRRPSSRTMRVDRAQEVFPTKPPNPLDQLTSSESPVLSLPSCLANRRTSQSFPALLGGC